DAGALDAHQLVKQCEAVKPRPAGTEEFAALESGGARLRYAEGHAGAVRLQHAERRAQGRAAERIEDQPERPVWLGGGEVAAEHDTIAAPFGDRRAMFLAPHMAPDKGARGGGELTGEMADPARGAVARPLAPEQQPTLAQRMQCGEAGHRQ